MNEQMSEVYRVGSGYSDYTPERLGGVINMYISNGWKVVSMVSITGESRSSVIVVYERGAEKGEERDMEDCGEILI